MVVGHFLNGSESGLKGSDKRSEAPPLREKFIPVYYFFGPKIKTTKNPLNH
jgi:hypothetical protein